MEEKIVLSAFIEVGEGDMFAICTDTNEYCMVSGFGDFFSVRHGEFSSVL